MTPIASQCFTILNACCRAIAKHDDWKIVVTEGSEVILLEILTRPQSAGSLIGRDGTYVQALRVLMKAVGQHSRRVIVNIEDW